jgi:hypothetical protein
VCYSRKEYGVNRAVDTYKKQVNAIWEADSVNMRYFKNQLHNPYYQTVAFFDFLESQVRLTPETIMIDACCGSMANSLYASKRFGLDKIIAFDFQDDFMELGRLLISRMGIEEKIISRNEDIFSLSSDFLEISADGIIFLQTLSWLTDWEKSIDSLSLLKAKWICISSLFYPGSIEALVQINVYNEDGTFANTSPYNILSIPRETLENPGRLSENRGINQGQD